MKPRVILVYIHQHLMRYFNYRADAIFWVVNGLVWQLIMLSFWLKVSQSQSNLAMSSSAIVTYFVFSSLVGRLTQAWSAERTAWKIKDGKLTTYLLRPIHYLTEDMGHDLGTKINRVTTLLPFFLILLFVYRNDISLPTYKSTWVAFFLACVLGFGVRYTFEITFGLLAFFITEILGVERMLNTLTQIINGSTIPLALLPLFLQNFAKGFFTRYYVSFPLEIILGQTRDVELVLGFIIGGIWITSFLFLYHWLWNKGVRRYTAVGI